MVKEKIIHYKIIPIAIIGIIMFLLDSLICRSIPLYTYSFINNAIETSVHVIALLFFILVTIIIIQQISYKDKTNRNLLYDRFKYHKGYIYLMDYFKDADTHIYNTNKLQSSNWKESEGIMLGTIKDKLVALPSDAEANLFIAGAPGSGKTSGIAIPTCLQYGGSILAVDIKGDLYNRCHNERNILRFCPDLKNEKGENIAIENSCTFDPFSCLKKLSDIEKKLYLQNMALTLIPDVNASDGNYFTSRARKIFLGLTSYLIYYKEDISFPEVLHFILHNKLPEGITLEQIPDNIFHWILLISKSPVTDAVEQLASLIGNNEKNVSGAFDCLVTALTPFSNPTLDHLLSNENPISIDTLNNGNDVYLQISQENLEVYAPLFTMIIASFMQEFTQRPDATTGIKNKPILILLDEFPQLTFSYSIINSALSTLRSKSVQCMLIAQSVAQLAYKYKNDGWRALLGNCTYQMILKSNEELTQKHFSTLFGTRRILKKSSSDSTYSSNNVQEDREPVYQLEDFGDLKNKLIIYFDGQRIEANKIRSYL